VDDCILSSPLKAILWNWPQAILWSILDECGCFDAADPAPYFDFFEMNVQTEIAHLRGHVTSFDSSLRADVTSSPQY